MSTFPPPDPLLAAEDLGKRYGRRDALNAVNFQISPGRVVGLLGRNGAGKTTLLNLASGILLPTTGKCVTLGVGAADLGTPQLSRLGVVQQEGSCLEWMTVRQHLDFVASFYPTWDAGLEKRLLSELELDPARKIAQLSTGDRQKALLLFALGHRPSLLLLDEPMSALDPIARERLLKIFLDLLRDEGTTVVISSHILTDVEKIVDWIICLDGGLLVEDASFDTLQESFGEWILTSSEGRLPSAFPESFVLSCKGGGSQVRLQVRTGDPEAAQRVAAQYGAEVTTRRISLDEMFPLLLRSRKAATPAARL